MNNEYIKRPALFSKLNDYKDKDLVKIITGIRRYGKSFLLFTIFYNYLLEHGIKENHIIAIKLDSKKNSNLRNSDTLFKYISSLIKNNDKYYVFIDEIQLMDEFEDLVNGLNLILMLTCISLVPIQNYYHQILEQNFVEEA